MPIKLLLLSTVASLFVVLSGCKKDIATSPNLPADVASTRLTNSVQLQQPTVNLGVAGNFAILSKSGITDVYPSVITGDIGTSPITGAAIGLTCSEVTGTTYSVNAAGPLPCVVIDASRLTTSVSDMQTAYTDAAGRSNPDFINLGAGDIGGKTLTRFV